MIAALILAFAIQSVSAAEPAQAQRVSEQLYYLRPSYSCSHGVARQQSRIFDRRFAGRIEALKQREAKALGPDPGFEVVAIGSCVRSAQRWSAAFARGIRRFDRGLAALEARYP